MANISEVKDKASNAIIFGLLVNLPLWLATKLANQALNTRAFGIAINKAWKTRYLAARVDVLANNVLVAARYKEHVEYMQAIQVAKTQAYMELLIKHVFCPLAHSYYEGEEEETRNENATLEGSGHSTTLSQEGASENIQPQSQEVK